MTHTMTALYDALAQRILDKASQLPPTQRLLIGIAGFPGSGKSTIAYPLVDHLNALSGSEVATCVGMDGWHYSQAELSLMPEPEKMFAARGAHFTFNAPSFCTFISSLLLPSSTSSELPFPTFSHAAKDPLPLGGSVLPHHRVVIIEGLYCFLGVEPWCQVGRVLSERVWIDIDREVARERLITRHLREGVETTREAAARRVDESDLINGDFLVANLMPPTLIIRNDILSEAGSMTPPAE